MAPDEPEVVAELVVLAVGLVKADPALGMAVKSEQPCGQWVDFAQGVVEAGLRPLVDAVALSLGAQAVVVVNAVDEEGLVKGPS